MTKAPLNDLIVQIRDVLQDPPSTEGWVWLCDALEQAHRMGEGPFVMDYIQGGAHPAVQAMSERFLRPWHWQGEHPLAGLGQTNGTHTPQWSRPLITDKALNNAWLPLTAFSSERDALFEAHMPDLERVTGWDRRRHQHRGGRRIRHPIPRPTPVEPNHATQLLSEWRQYGVRWCSHHGVSLRGLSIRIDAVKIGITGPSARVASMQLVAGFGVHLGLAEGTRIKGGHRHTCLVEAGVRVPSQHPVLGKAEVRPHYAEMSRDGLCDPASTAKVIPLGTAKVIPRGDGQGDPVCPNYWFSGSSS